MEKGVGLPQDILESFDCREQDVRNFSPLTLAYIGDCVYELIVRTMVVERGNRPPRKLHNESSEFSKAGTQRKIYEALLDEVTKEEADILRRGKNAHFHTKAKNATVLEYRSATALEALLGYLYLTGKMERVLELLKIGLRKCEMNL
jgi:ribonuclease-3 family protein